MFFRNGAVPRSPNSKKENGGQFDQGYDSYSLSSTDSLPLQQGLKHSLQLAQIPEARVPGVYNQVDSGEILPMGQDCEQLCQEADDLMNKSKMLEDQHDYEGALVLIQAACAKSRAAMDAPYSNPANITLARMKHNSCVVGLRSLQRKMNGDKDGTLEGRHSRENSCSSVKSKGNHSRQNSRDSNKGQHSRQNSRELLLNSQPATKPGNLNKSKEKLPQPVVGVHNISEKPSKNIEIYATLPKKKNGVMSRVKSKSNNDSPPKNIIEDAEYLIYDRPGRDKNRGRDKNDKALSPVKEKRARSEERNKKSDFGSSQMTGKDSGKKQTKEPEVKNANKKQHKIRRKLLMGGLIRRKNRSMPDLREDEDLKNPDLKTQDDTSIKSSLMVEKQLSGYLSEGHLEFAGNATNPNLERSRLMRKSFHGSVGKFLHAAKVPPPPPIRTTSQLSKSSPERPKYPLPNEMNPYGNHINVDKSDNGMFYSVHETEAGSLPYMPVYTADTYSAYKDDPVQYANGNISAQNELTQVITRAQIHQEPQNEQMMNENNYENNGANLPLPPYPSPLNSVVHSRQASEEFPPPPEEVLIMEEASLLTQLQIKRQQILADKNKIDKENNKMADGSVTNQQTTSSNSLLKELQAKLQQKLNGNNNSRGDSSEDIVDFVETMKQKSDDLDKMNSVKDLTSKFEQIRVVENKEREEENFCKTRRSSSSSEFYRLEKPKMDDVPAEMLEMNSPSKRVADMLPTTTTTTNFTTSVLKLTGEEENEDNDMLRRKNGGSKKKNVTFCDQVVLVATADDDEEDNFIPNPILERVLRSALNKDPNDKTNRSLSRTHPLYKAEFSDQEKNQLITKMTPGERSKPPPIMMPHHNAMNVPQVVSHESECNGRLNNQQILYTQNVDPRLNPTYSGLPESGRPNSSDGGKGGYETEYMRASGSSGYVGKNDVHRMNYSQSQQQQQQQQFDSNRYNAHYPLSDVNRGYHHSHIYGPPTEVPRSVPQQIPNSIQPQQYSQQIPLTHTQTYQYSQQIHGDGVRLPPQQQQQQYLTQEQVKSGGGGGGGGGGHPYVHVPHIRNQPYGANVPDLQNGSGNRYVEVRKPTKDAMMVVNDQNFESGRCSVMQQDKSSSVRLPLQKTPQMARATLSLSQNPPFSNSPNHVPRPNSSYQTAGGGLPGGGGVKGITQQAKMPLQQESKPIFPPYYHPLVNKVTTPPQQTTSYPRYEPIKSKQPPQNYPPYQQPPPPKQIPMGGGGGGVGVGVGGGNCKINEMRQSQENLLQGGGGGSGTGTKTNPCHLCRKKQVPVPGLYCPGCDFYMSRFRPKNN